jgi:isopentenyl diphosphate isomerase/L-lactate dehydrogenase-like FMN-dependent dehydrogenase
VADDLEPLLRAIDILREEPHMSMALRGAGWVADLGPHPLRVSGPPLPEERAAVGG